MGLQLQPTGQLDRRKTVLMFKRKLFSKDSIREIIKVILSVGVQSFSFVRPHKAEALYSISTSIYIKSSICNRAEYKYL